MSDVIVVVSAEYLREQPTTHAIIIVLGQDITRQESLIECGWAFHNEHRHADIRETLISGGEYICNRMAQFMRKGEHGTRMVAPCRKYVRMRVVCAGTESACRLADVVHAIDPSV